MFKRHKVENMLFNNAIILSEMDGNFVIFAALLFHTIGLYYIFNCRSQELWSDMDYILAPFSNQ